MFLSGLRRTAYRFGLVRVVRLPVPVIVVGNITIGGSGKTPLVVWLAQQLRAAGYSPAVISRGYQGSAKSITQVSPNSDPALVGDEPVLLSRRGPWPVWVGRDRVAVGEKLLAEHPECDVIISDDGLQHYRLQRDVEIAVIDAEYQFGNGLRLPAGPLRESVKRLQTVDAVVSNGVTKNPKQYAMYLRGDIFRCVANSAETANANDFKAKQISALAGIGNPERFFKQLDRMGLVFSRTTFPDHHAFKPQDLQSIKAEVILMTEKDAVKCAAFAKANWWYLPVSAEVDERLSALVMNKLRSLNGP